MELTPDNNPFFERPKEEKKNKSLIVDILQSVVIAFFICIVIYLFIATPNQVNGPSMLDNFHDGELLLTNRLVQWFTGTQLGNSLGLEYQRGDVIVFQKPGYDPFIKRIIGVEGDRVALQDGYVYVNGEKLNETYLPTDRRTYGGTYLANGEEITVKTGHYFVMGDNRGNSTDSRDARIGQINKSWMIGKVVLRYWPPQQFSFIGTGETVPLEDSSNNV